MSFNFECPFPIQKYPVVTMAHGGGGFLMHQLIDKMFASAFKMKGPQHDSKVLPWTKAAHSLAFTTDSYVIQPIEFPGGNIGSLAVHGTVNDLAMSGARPLYLSAGFILEEGLAMDVLWRVVQEMALAAKDCEVEIVTGDTKVVERGHGDGIYINTSGVGIVEHDLSIYPEMVRPGDAVILSGDIGRHGVAIMAHRAGIEFSTEIKSDSASLTLPILELIKNKIEIRCLRDCTRGGVLSTLNEIGDAAKVTIQINEVLIPVLEEVRGACEMLGLDPLAVANEGRFVAIVPVDQKENTLKILKQFSVTEGAICIGEVYPRRVSALVIESLIGTHRIAPMLSGEQLPRIC